MNLSLGVRGRKLTTHLHVVPRSRVVELYFQFPIYLHGIVLKYRDNCTCNCNCTQQVGAGADVIESESAARPRLFLSEDFHSSPSCECWDGVFKLAMTASFHSLCNSSFINHSVAYCYIV
jgi:hypothetical protein